MVTTPAVKPVTAQSVRVFSYIDGFNLFYGMCDKAKMKHHGVAINQHWNRYSWLDLWRFSQSLLVPGQQLIHTKYFTSRIKGRPDSEQRQSTYLDALGTLPNLSIFYGLFQPDQKNCAKCGNASFPLQEKRTDVNIATQMIHDALLRNFDVAILVSGDSDQVPTIEMIRSVFKRKVIVAFPPQRFSAQLQKVATGSFRIGEAKLQGNTLPPAIHLPSGKILSCPKEWI
jgi:uncharacterized LabA/DUF88 family protein